MDLCGGEAYISKSRTYLKQVGIGSPSFRVSPFPSTFDSLTIITRAQIRLSVPACGRNDMNEATNPLRRDNSIIMHCLNHNNLPCGLISFMAGVLRIRHISGSVRRVQLDVELI